MKKIIVAIDSFKGCLTSAEANQAACEGILQRMPEAKVVQVPVSDGGEGWLEAFYAAMGGSIVEVNVKDPLMRPIVTQYLIQGDTAVIEIRRAQPYGGHELRYWSIGGRCHKTRLQAHHRRTWWKCYQRLWHRDA